MTNKSSPNGQSWWGRLSEGSKAVLIAALITGVLGIAGTVIGVLLTSSSSNGPTSSGQASSAGTPTAPTNVSSTDGGSSAVPGFTAAYQNSSVVIQTLPGGACGYGESVNVNKPSVDPSSTSGDSFSFSSSNCDNWAFEVDLQNQASGSQPSPASQAQDNPSACLKAIASDPIPQSDTVKAGDAFCIKSADNFLAYVKVVSVDSNGDVILRLDGWSTGASAADGGSSAVPGFTAAYQNSSVVIQTLPGGACGYGESVNVNKPSVDPSSTSGDSFSFSSSNCDNWTFEVDLQNQASGSQPSPASQAQDNPSACLKAIASDPIPQSDTAKAGDAFCIKSTDNFLAYVKVVSVDSQGKVVVRLDGWSTN